jgi:glycosidase
MFKEAVYHRPRGSYAYAYDEKTIHIRLRTKKSDVEKVLLIIGDPYDFDKDRKWMAEKQEMNKIGSDELFDYWLAAVCPHHRRLRYGFELHGDGESLVFTEKGFYESAPLDDIVYYFCFPFIHKNDLLKTPSWVKDTIWYQIFPERFANGDPSNDPEGAVPWNSEEPKVDNFFGGDFQGIIDHLDYLKELGINGIYFNPIFIAPTNHKYDTKDYKEIDPQFGDKDSLKTLIKECHDRGIKVMLDAVFNHCGYEFPPFQDVLEKGEKSKYKDWFHLHGFPLKTKPIPNYDTFAYEHTMPKLNTAHPEAKKYFLEVGTYWVKEFDIDGWRLDVANEVDHHFWKEFRHAVKSIKEDVYILGEIWHDSLPWLEGDQFDAVMNYPFTTGANNFFLKDMTDTAQFKNTMQTVLNMYPQQVTEVSFNLLGSHDTPRILTIADGNLEKVKQALAFQFSFPGSPCIYYGDEIGMAGDNDPGCRACMIWDEEKQDQDMLGHVKKLISLRRSLPVMRNEGNFRILEASSDDQPLIYTRENNEQKLICVMSHKDRETHVDLPPELELSGKKIKDIWTDETMTFQENNLQLTLPPYGFKFMLLTK